MSLDGMEAVCVQQECDSDGLCVMQECDSDGLCVMQECDSDGLCVKQECDSDGLCVKQECDSDGLCVMQECDSDGLCVMQECDSDGLCVKQEFDSDGCGDNEAALAALYEDHMVKQELVLGPEMLQKPSVVYTPPASVTRPVGAASVKREPQWDSDDANYELDEEQELAPVVLIEELELGPVVLQPPDAVYAFQALQPKEQPGCGTRAVPRGTCSVLLEPMIVNMELCMCKIGHQIYEFRSCPENDFSQSDKEFYSSKKFGSQARLHAAKKTESSKTNKRKAPVEEKKEKPNEKITKTYSAKKKPGTSAASQDWSSSTDVQEATPAMPASSSSSGVNTLTAETDFKCEKCGKGFNIKSDLEKHLNTHMLMEAGTSRKVYKFTCKTCNCTFDTKLLLQEHEKSRHGVKYFACDECEYATKLAGNLKTHLRTHTGEKSFKCSQCSFAFTDKANLRVHLRIHTGEKPFECSQCSSAFISSSYLRVHLRTHTGEKPHKCSQCSSAFTTSSYLRVHLRTHTGEKPHKCSQCSSAFTTSGDLRVHLRTHTGEKPFECNICDYKTTRSSTLKSHLMSRHSGQKPFRCDACSYRAATRGIVRLHMKRHHKPG